MLSIGIDTAPQSFCHSFIALSMIDTLSEVGPEFAVQVCQVARPTVVMKTTQLVQGSKPI